jgi:hypothetical protein
VDGSNLPPVHEHPPLYFKQLFHHCFPHYTKLLPAFNFIKEHPLDSHNLTSADTQLLEKHMKAANDVKNALVTLEGRKDQRILITLEHAFRTISLLPDSYFPPHIDRARVGYLDLKSFTFIELLIGTLKPFEGGSWIKFKCVDLRKSPPTSNEYWLPQFDDESLPDVQECILATVHKFLGRDIAHKDQLIDFERKRYISIDAPYSSFEISNYADIMDLDPTSWVFAEITVGDLSSYTFKCYVLHEILKVFDN